jgi:hypothetical protein
MIITRAEFVAAREQQFRDFLPEMVKFLDDTVANIEEEINENLKKANFYTIYYLRKGICPAVVTSMLAVFRSLF